MKIIHTDDISKGDVCAFCKKAKSDTKHKRLITSTINPKVRICFDCAMIGKEKLDAVNG